MPKVVLYITVGMLLVGLLPLPYGYYTLLRLVACGVFAWAAFITYERKEEVLPWLFGLLAIVFNPIIKIHFPKELWAIIDISSGLLLLFVSKKIVSNEQKANSN
uniref:DUF6804 family protein n=1 Tax=Shewanella gaetbuli TaxID=220752 RepID=UPI003B5948A4